MVTRATGPEDDASQLGGRQRAHSLGRLVHAYTAARRHEISPLSYQRYADTLRLFARSVGTTRTAASITRGEIEQWFLSRGWAPSTRRHVLSILKNFWLWAIEQGYCTQNPTLGIRRMREPRRLPRGLSHDEVAAVFAACPDARFRLIISLMVQEGLRCGEVARLELGDIDMADRLVRVVGKGGHERVLPLSEETFDNLRIYLASTPIKGGPLIRRASDPMRGMTAERMSQVVNGLMHGIGLAESAHALRHTAATDVLRGGAHIRDVQAMLGHVSLVTTQHYMPLVVRDLRDAMGGRRYRP